MHDFFSSGWFNYLLLPAMIFIARICDVTLDTLRIIFVSKGNKLVAPILGFFEVLIWIIAITRIIKNLSNPVCYIAYAAGFATGNYVGLLVEERLAVGIVLIRIITTREVPELTLKLSQLNIGITSIEAKGSKGKVNVIFTVVPRTIVQDALHLILESDREAFYSIEDIRSVNKGIFPSKLQTGPKIDFFRRWRKGV